MPLDSPVALWNMALQRIGITSAVTGYDPDTVAPSLEARLCSERWQGAVDETLEARIWPFALSQVVAAALAPVAAPFGWAYAYRLPAGCLYPVALIYGGTRYALLRGDQRLRWEVQSDATGDGLLFCCDVASTDFDALEFTRALRNPSSWPAMFTSAVAWRLAAELALAIMKGQEGRALHDDAVQRWHAGVAFAHAASSRNHREADAEPLTESLAARL